MARRRTITPGDRIANWKTTKEENSRFSCRRPSSRTWWWRWVRRPARRSPGCRARAVTWLFDRTESTGACWVTHRPPYRTRNEWLTQKLAGVARAKAIPTTTNGGQLSTDRGCGDSAGFVVDESARSGRGPLLPFHYRRLPTTTTGFPRSFPKRARRVHGGCQDYGVSRISIHSYQIRVWDGPNFAPDQNVSIPRTVIGDWCFGVCLPSISERVCSGIPISLPHFTLR